MAFRIVGHRWRLILCGTYGMLALLSHSIKPGDLVDVWGTDLDWYGYVATGIVVEIRQVSWTTPDEILVLGSKGYGWYDTRHFMFCKAKSSQE